MGKITHEGLIIVSAGCSFKMDISHVRRDFTIHNVVSVLEELQVCLKNLNVGRYVFLFWLVKRLRNSRAFRECAILVHPYRLCRRISTDSQEELSCLLTSRCPLALRLVYLRYNCTALSNRNKSYSFRMHIYHFLELPHPSNSSWYHCVTPTSPEKASWNQHTHIW